MEGLNATNAVFFSQIDFVDKQDEEGMNSFILSFSSMKRLIYCWRRKQKHIDATLKGQK